MPVVACTNCRQPYPEEGIPYQCTRCGGIFDFIELPAFDQSYLEPELPGIWRYRHAFGLPENAPIVSLGEGSTPMLWGEAQGLKVAFKCEYLNPTGSFKDRGSAPLISFLKSRGAESAVEDSSGNAGASFAAYAARANMKGRVFVPDSAAGPKRAQIEAYGAELVRILGPRSNASEAVRRAADQGAVYASHAYLPFNLPGYATVAYELFEQLGEAPGAVILPVGQGGLLLGIGRGFQMLQKAGVISHVPQIIGVQARACAPLWAVSAYGLAGMGFVTEEPTLAEGVRVRFPLRGDAVLQFLEANRGLLVAVDEEEILPGRDLLACQGFYVEPTSAIVWQALAQVRELVSQPIVVILTGSGLKYFPW